MHFTVRLDEDRVCTLVMVGVRADGKKELVALGDGHRESTTSWADLLRDCRRRGMRAPVLAVGDGALGSGPRCARCSPPPSTFVALFGAEYPKAVAKIVDDREQLLAFYDFPAEHWVHLKTSNPIESTFATVRLRTKVTKGPGSRAAGLAMVCKLLQARPGALALRQRRTPGGSSNLGGDTVSA